MNEIMLKLRLMHLYHTESTSIGADNPTNVNPPVAYSSTTADFLEHKLSVALPDQNKSIFDQPHACISADNQSTIFIAHHRRFPNLSVDKASQILAIDDLRPVLRDFFAGRSYSAQNGRCLSSPNCPLLFSSLHVWNKFAFSTTPHKTPSLSHLPKRFKLYPQAPLYPLARQIQSFYLMRVVI